MKFSTAEPPGASDSTPVITPDFNIYTSAMEVDDTQENVVRMVGSSTERDLQGDTMALSALTDMASVQAGQVTWLNHKYDLPDSLFGSLVKSPSLTLEAGIADIHIVSDVESSNPDALQTFGYIKKGRRLGCSIGCMVTEFEVDEEHDNEWSWWPPIIILHVLVLEFSVVGVPANQRCWVETATKGLFERMLSENKGDQALKLAPAVKGLYPRLFQDKLKSLENAALRRDLERVEVRTTPKQRVEWVPNERVFVVNQRGIYTPVKRQEVSTLLTKGSDSPRFPGFARESTKGTAVLPETDVMSFMRPEPGTVVEKGASGKTDWPLADRKRPWDNGEAHNRIKEWAGGDDPDWSKVKSVHFWYGDDGNKWGDFKLLFCDVVDGAIKAIPRGIFACVGGHGLAVADIPEADVPAIKKKIEAYYKRMADEFDDPDIKVPWDDEKAMETEPEKQAGVKITDSFVNSTTTCVNPTVMRVQSAYSAQEERALADIQEAEERYDEEHAHILSSGTGTWQHTADPLDVQLYNALAAKFGQPQLTLSETGQIITPRPEPAISPEMIQAVLTRALEMIKSGNEFSKENRDSLQALHDGIVNMCMSSFHPCKEMAAANDDDKNDPDHDGDSAYDNDGDGDGAVNYVPAKSLQEYMMMAFPTAKIEQLQDKMDALLLTFEGASLSEVKDLQKQAGVLQRQFKELTGKANATKEDIGKLRNLPLGRPTALTRSVHAGDVTVSYEDLMGCVADKDLPMNDNERKWTLEEALKSTTITLKQVGSDAIRYRHWPEGVGGSVKNGVRPQLTGDQRSLMRPPQAVAYADGLEADVVCYDDPGGVAP